MRRSASGAQLTNTFVAGQFAVALDVQSDLLRRSIGELFVDLVVATRQPDEVWTVDTLDVGFRLSGPDIAGVRFEQGEWLLAELVRLINRKSLDADPTRLHLHAGCVVRDGKALVLSAPSTGGKSTLTAFLSSKQWTYVSDEAVGLDSSGEVLSGFPKPLSLRQGGADLLPGLRARCVAIGGSQPVDGFIPASSIAATISAASPGLVVVMSRDDTTTNVSMQRLRPSEAVVELVSESLDFDRFGPGALAAVASLCASSHCYELQVGCLDDMGRLLDTAMNERILDDPAGATETLANSGSLAHVSDHVERVWMGQNDVVIYNNETKAVFNLVDAAATVWRTIEGGEMPQSSAERQLVDELHRLGCVKNDAN